jgi:peptidyl-prolyl cis-trans isomerase C
MKKTTTKLSAIILITTTLVLPSCKTSINEKFAVKNSRIPNPEKIIVASYNDGKVSLKDVESQINKLTSQNDKLNDSNFYQLNTNQKENLIKEIVLKKIYVKEAKKRSLDKDEDYKQALIGFESELLRQKLLIALAKDVDEEKDLEENYKKLIAKTKEKKDIKISYIIVKTKNEAFDIYHSILKSPNSFTATAKKKSLDKETAQQGGNLGFVMEDFLPISIVKQARSVVKGEIAKPIQSADKWLIIKLVDERPAKITSFNESKRIMLRNLQQKAVEDFIKKSLEKAKINIFTK